MTEYFSSSGIEMPVFYNIDVDVEQIEISLIVIIVFLGSILGALVFRQLRK
jgi:hypothetical protein